MPSIVHGCGAKLHFPSEMAGRKGRCPTCGEAVEVPIDSGSSRAGLAPRPQQPKPPKMHLDPPPEWEKYQAFLEGKGENPRPLVVPANLLLKDEADARWAAAQAKGTPSKFFCPGCKDRLEVYALVCMKCGLDLRTGFTLDGKTKLNGSGLEYLKRIPWIAKALAEAEAEAGEKKKKISGLRKRRPS